MLGKAGERWDRTAELLKGLAALPAGAEPVQHPGQGREKLFPVQLQWLSQGQLEQLWGWRGICVQPHRLPRAQHPPSSRNIPGSWRLEASFPARERQKLSVHSGDGANVGKLRLWEGDSRDFPSCWPQSLPRDPPCPGCARSPVPQPQGTAPGRSPRHPKLLHCFISHHSRPVIPAGSSPERLRLQFPVNSTSLSPLMEHQLLLNCGNNSRKKRPPQRGSESAAPAL